MNIIRNLSVLILFFGIIIMTVYITKSYGNRFNNQIMRKARLDIKKKEMNKLLKKHNSERPSKVFGNMFSEPTVWMGYSDQDTINKDISTYESIDSKIKRRSK